MRDPKQRGLVAHSRVGGRIATLMQRHRDRENNTAPRELNIIYLFLLAKKDLSFNELFVHSSL